MIGPSPFSAAAAPVSVPPSFSRRRLLRLGAALGTGLLAAACGRRAPEAARGALSLWTLDLAPRFKAYLAGVIADWERLHPGHPVVWTDVPWSSVERKLLAAVFARTAPDLVNLNPPFAANLASKGGLCDLTPLLPPDASARYLPRIWQAGAQEGQQFAVPWYLTARVTLANRRLLEQAGLEAPPQFWSEVPAYAEAVRRRTGRYGLFVTVVPDDSAELLEALVQMGVTLLDAQRRAAFLSPAGLAAFRFWTELYRQGLLPREVVSQGYRRAIEMYQAGDLAQVASGPDFLRNLQTNAPAVATDTRPYSPLTGADGAANVAVMNLVVPRRSPRAAEAVALALLLTDADHQLRFCREARVLPSSRQALAALDRELEGEQPATTGERLVRDARRLSLATLERARVLVPPMAGIKRLQAILYTQLQRAMLAQVSSEGALEQAALDWNRYAAARWP